MVHIIEFVNTTTDTSPAVTTTTTTTTTAASITSTATVITPITTTTTTLTLSPTLSSSSQSDDDNSSSVGVTVAIVVVLVVVVLIIITVVVIGIIVVWKRKKCQQHTKPEGVYYSTIDDDRTMLQSTPSNKPEAIYSEMNDGEDSKEPQYMDVTKSEQADEIGNSAYSENQVKIQDNPAYSVTNM